MSYGVSSRKFTLTIFYDLDADNTFPPADFDEVQKRLEIAVECGVFTYACLNQERARPEHADPKERRLHGHVFLRYADGTHTYRQVADLLGLITHGNCHVEETISDWGSYTYVACVDTFADGQPQGKPTPLKFWESSAEKRPVKKVVGAKKTDYKKLVEMIDSGASFSDVCRAYPAEAVRGFTNLQKFYNFLRCGNFDTSGKPYVIKKGV